MGDMIETLLARRRVIVAAALALLAVVIAARLMLRPRPAATAPALPPPVPAQIAPARVVVHVVGAVRRPGLYRLGQGARIADAVARAGGASRKADLAGVNLAAPLADGEQVVVPVRGPAAAAGSGAAGGGAAAAAPSAGASTGPVHLSTATLEQLDSLPGVGPVTAQKILDYRDQHGAFTSVDELDAVPGIGPARLEQLRELVAP
jgi:competence protein ComEA